MATELQQKEKALEEVPSLRDLSKQRREIVKQLQRVRGLPRTPARDAAAKNLEDNLQTLDIEWKVVSASITDKIKSGENHKRYSEGDYKTNLLAVLAEKTEQCKADRTEVEKELKASRQQHGQAAIKLRNAPDRDALKSQRAGLLLQNKAIKEKITEGEALLKQRLAAKVTRLERNEFLERLPEGLSIQKPPDEVIKLARNVELQRFAEEEKTHALEKLETAEAQIEEMDQKLSAPDERAGLGSKEKQLALRIRELEKKEKLLNERSAKLTERKQTVSDEKGDLIDQGQTLPYLVRECRQKIVFTPGQLEKIEIILDDPNAVEEFRMGLGKSSVIFPCVARILISRGVFPVMIFTETLLEQSREDMDKKAYIFNFGRASSTLPQTLAEEYYSLLFAKHSGRYIMTTVDRIAALRNKIIEIHNVQSQQYAQYASYLQEER